MLSLFYLFCYCFIMFISSPLVSIGSVNPVDINFKKSYCAPLLSMRHEEMSTHSRSNTRPKYENYKALFGELLVTYGNINKGLLTVAKICERQLTVVPKAHSSMDEGPWNLELWSCYSMFRQINMTGRVCSRQLRWSEPFLESLARVLLFQIGILNLRVPLKRLYCLHELEEERT